jgi:hypothetical protein
VEILPPEMRQIKLNCGFWTVTYNPINHRVIYGLSWDRHGSSATFTDDAIVFPVVPVIPLAPMLAPLIPLTYISQDVTDERLTMRVEWD